MAIRMMDLALPLQRSTEMLQNARGENRPEVQHQQFAERLGREKELQSQQVQKTPESESAFVNKDGRGNQGGAGGRRNKKKEAEKKQQQVRNSMLDLSI